MGVAGSGKTTVGRALADRLGADFADADDFHPEANVKKMARGEPLTDEDREPWLDRIAQHIAERREHRVPTVFTCSALKSSYRRQLGLPHPDIALVHLVAPHPLIRERVKQRQVESDHFMPEELVDSQFRDLEPPDDAININANRPVEQQVDEIVRAIDH